MILTHAELAAAGLVSIAVPIAIHLLSRRRRRPLPWAAMRFLLEAFKKHNRRVRLEQWLLLLLRCAVPVLIGLALARPIVGEAGSFRPGSRRMVFLVIDNSLTSGLTDENGHTALERHVDSAVEVVSALEPGDAVGVITAARPARALLAPPSADHVSVNRVLRSIEPTESPCDIPQALEALQAAIGRDESEPDQYVCFLLSEFRTGSARLDQALPEAICGEAECRLLATSPSTTPAPNVRIVSAIPARRLMLDTASDLAPQVTVDLARSGGDLAAEATRVSVQGPGLAPAEPEIIRWSPGQVRASATIPFRAAVEGDREIALTASIDNDRLIADNTQHIVIELREGLDILLIDRLDTGSQPTLDRLSAGMWIERALRPSDEGPIQTQRVEPAALTGADLRTADCVVLARPDLLDHDSWASLRSYVDSGGLLLIVPPGRSEVHRWTGHLRDELSLPWRIELEVVTDEEGLALSQPYQPGRLLSTIAGDLAELGKPVRVWRYLRVETRGAEARAELSLEDGAPLLLAGTPQAAEADDQPGDGSPGSHGSTAARGLVVLFAAAPELGWTNLPSKPLMVPLFHELVRQGLNGIREARRFRVGERPVMAPTGKGWELAHPDGWTTTMDEAGRPRRPLLRSGVHQLRDRWSMRTESIAVNIDTDTGMTDPQPESSVMAWLAGSGPWQTYDPSQPADALSQTGSRSSLAGAAIVLAIALVLIETVLARRFSYAYRDGVMNISGGLRPTVEEFTSAGTAS